jgi:hypothetical protein
VAHVKANGFIDGIVKIWTKIASQVYFWTKINDFLNFGPKVKYWYNHKDQKCSYLFSLIRMIVGPWAKPPKPIP